MLSGLFLPITATYTYDGGSDELTIVLSFDRIMSSHVPVLADLNINVDGTNYPAGGLTHWANAQQLSISVSDVHMAPTTVKLSYNGNDHLFGDTTINIVQAFTNMVVSP